MKIHVLTNKAEIKNEKLDDKVVIVLDILFATTSIVSAFKNGCTLVVPAPNSEIALKFSQYDQFKDYILSGELNADTLDGFASPTPLALIETGISQKGLIYCTTNGTVALDSSKSAQNVYAGSLLNGAALVNYVLNKHPSTSTILIVCSGSNNQFNLEDFFGAGQIVNAFQEKDYLNNFSFTDSAFAASELYRSSSPEIMLKKSRVGQMMLDRGLENEVIYAAQENITDVIPYLDKFGYLRVVNHES